MKELIVLLASVILGVFLFGLIAGSGEGSVYSSVKSVWDAEIQMRTVRDAAP